MRILVTILAVFLTGCYSSSEIQKAVIKSDAKFESINDNTDSPHIIIIGEVHDDPTHHIAQTQMVTEIQPSAIVFEMIPIVDTPELAEARANRASRAQIKQLLAWEQLAWYDFDWYAPIMEAAPEAKVYGAARSKSDISQAFKQGAAYVAGEQAKQYGLIIPLSKSEREARLALQDKAHCGKMPKKMLSNMVEVQRLRDADFARIALSALNETGGPVVVIIGNGHAREDWGVPAIIRRVAPSVSLQVITQQSTLKRDYDPCDNIPKAE